MSQLDPDAFLAWGWRLPFLLSAVLVLVGLVIRLSIAESPEFEKVREAAVEVKMPIAEAFRRHPKEIFLVAGTYLSQGVLAYITMSYLVSYGTTQLKIARPSVLMGVFVAAVIATILYPVFGSLADRWGRKTTYLLGAVLMLVEHRPRVRPDQHRGRVRVRHRSRAHLRHRHGAGRWRDRVAVQHDLHPRGPLQRRVDRLHDLPGRGAAFAPLIATALFAINGSSGPVVIYLLVVCAISVVSVLLLPGRLGKADPLTGLQPAVAA